MPKPISSKPNTTELPRNQSAPDQNNKADSKGRSVTKAEPDTQLSGLQEFPAENYRALSDCDIKPASPQNAIKMVQNRLASKQKQLCECIVFGGNPQIYREKLGVDLQLAIHKKRSDSNIDLGTPVSADEQKKIVNDCADAIRHEGNEILPAYINTARDTPKPAVRVQPGLVTMEHLKELSADKKQMLTDCACLCKCSYSGVKTAANQKIVPDGYHPVSNEQLPLSLQMFYDEETGLLHAPDNVKALLAQKDNELVVAFAGTELAPKGKTGRSGTIKTDIIQRLGQFSSTYRTSAGIVFALLLHKQPGFDSIRLTGHSMGGGMAQFATAATKWVGQDRLGEVVTFNSAGLAANTLRGLGQMRVDAAQHCILNLRVKGDPVSPSGTTHFGSLTKGRLIGKVATITDPKNHTNAHSMATMRDVLNDLLGTA